jgi:flavin reductase (DIM6/NTAB) family NADH-FMN oxidoreductase RutF
MGMITLDSADLTPQQSYKLLAGAVVPRPIAWVTTLAEDGAVNLAPFSSYIFLAYDPRLVGISVGPGTATSRTRWRSPGRGERSSSMQ